MEPLGGFQQTVVLNGPVENGVAVLVDDEGHMELIQNGRGLLQRLAVVIGQAHIQGLAAADRLLQSAHGLLQRGIGVHAVVVEDVHIGKSHALEALVQAGQQIFPAAKVAVGAVPHGVARFGGDDQLVPIGGQILPEDLAEVLLGSPGLGTVVVGQVEVGNAVVKGRAAEITHIFIGSRVAEVVPEPQGEGSQLQAGSAAAPVGDRLIAGRSRLIHGNHSFILISHIIV